MENTNESSGFAVPAHFWMLFWVSVVTVSGLLIRNQIIGDHNYNFLLWNLFLGFVPLGFAWLVSAFEAKLNWLLLWVGAGMWLLFYPNAPYMISDFIHVDQSESYVLYDALMIFSIAILSTFYGLYSLALMRDIFTKRYTPTIANIVVAASIVLAAFGVYLGRILRLNSWDLFTKPIETLKMIFDHLFPFSDNPQTWSLVLIFSVLQVFLLLLVHGMNNLKST